MLPRVAYIGYRSPYHILYTYYIYNIITNNSYVAIVSLIVGTYCNWNVTIICLHNNNNNRILSELVSEW